MGAATGALLKPVHDSVPCDGEIMPLNPLKVALEQPSLYRVLIRLTALTNCSERALRTITKDRLGVLDLMGLPSIQLTVAGRKTGVLRTTSVQYVPDGDLVLVVASNWGSDRHPAWSANLGAANGFIRSCPAGRMSRPSPPPLACRKRRQPRLARPDS